MYLAAIDGYQRMPYARCGRSGLQLPRISLGLWQVGCIAFSPLAQGLLTTKYCLGALKNLQFSQDELRKIDQYAVDSNLNIWAPRGVDGR
jgi:aryl-alcohol dehydrogenase-like predicted oxidoreductase